MFNRFRTRVLGPVGVLLIGIGGLAAQSSDEKLLFTVPKGYKVGFQDKSDLRQLTEFVPQSETVENWSEMITVQVFYTMRTTRPIACERQMLLTLKRSCPTAEAAHVADGVENGHAFSLWIEQFCADPATGKSETTHFKAIQGNDALYVVQKAFKAPLTKERTLEATRFLQPIQVCDARGTDHPCPGPKRPRSATETPI